MPGTTPPSTQRAPDRRKAVSGDWPIALGDYFVHSRREPLSTRATQDASSGLGPPARGQTVLGRESRTGRFRHKVHRTRLHVYAFGAVALLVYVVALAAANTRHVRVDWVFGHSFVPLVWLVLFTAILGWLLGIGDHMPLPLAHARAMSVLNGGVLSKAW